MLKLLFHFCRSLFTKKPADNGTFKNNEILWQDIEQLIGCSIENRQFYTSALRHSSYLPNNDAFPVDCYERLEFLGDAVLSFIVGEFLFRSFPKASEGKLTKMRARLVSRGSLARKGRELKIGKLLLLGPGEEKTGGRDKDSILAGSLEALIGAVYFDHGINKTREFIERKLFSDYKNILSDRNNKNFKGELLEYSQRVYKKGPKYILKKAEGAEHQKLYTIIVQINNRILGEGKGSNKKEAEQQAAERALNAIIKNQS